VVPGAASPERLQRADALRKRITIITGDVGGGSRGFIVRQVKVRHEPDMVPVRALINLIDRRRALVRGAQGGAPKPDGGEGEPPRGLSSRHLRQPRVTILGKIRDAPR
jgi:hypothetical protein